MPYWGWGSIPDQYGRRLSDLLQGENLGEQWYAFSTDRLMGRARDFLADNGTRVG